MPPPTRKQQKEAAIQMRKKLRMESQLFRKMRRFFKRQTREIFDTYSATGNITNAAAFEPELEKMLTAHYRKAVRTFAPRVMNEINAAAGVSSSDGLSMDNAVIAAALLAMITANVKSSAAYLSKDTNKVVKKTIEAEDTAMQARNRVNAGITSRSDRHATNVNQQAIEGTKQRVAGSAQSAINVATALTIVLRQKKTWIAIIDRATRPWHMAVNGLTIDVDKPFVVAGERLMYPGDYSMGASAKNLERCRCVSVNTTSIAR